MNKSIFLDYNATTPLSSKARQAMIMAMNLVGNPSSIHHLGRNTRQIIDDARQTIQTVLDTKFENVIFTSSGTEANNLALNGIEDSIAITSTIEHVSVLDARLDSQHIGVNHDGMIDIKALEKKLKYFSYYNIKTLLVSIMMANNETGIIQPFEEIIEIAHYYGAKVHCDAIQALGKCKFNINDIDMVSLSAHKIGGPKGIGVLLTKSDILLKAQIKGGGQEKYIRAGTENIIGIVGFAASIMHTYENITEIEKIEIKRNRLEKELKLIIPTLSIIGHSNKRLVNTSCIVLPEIPSQTQLIALDLKGICVSAGSACSSGKISESHVLKAMGISNPGCSIRVSLGRETVEQDIDIFIKVYSDMYIKRLSRNKNSIQ